MDETVAHELAGDDIARALALPPVEHEGVRQPLLTEADELAVCPDEVAPVCVRGGGNTLVETFVMAVSRSAASRVPHERRAGRIVYKETNRDGPTANAEERAAYEAAMTENILVRAVLDDLKWESSHPNSM